MTKNISIRMLGLAMIALLAGFGQVFAQSTVTGAISGRITDPQGSIVPNATVNVTNTGTNQSVSTTATGNGDYRVANLQPGRYRVESSVSGFASFTANNIVVEVGQTTNVNIALAVEGTSAEVVVTAEAPVVNTSDNSNATNINQTDINELPINGRRWSNFAILTPSAVPDGQFGLISFRGVSGLLNNNTIDGGDNNQAFFSEERGRTRINYSISQAAIREFQVNTSNYSAEYGRSAGGVTNAVTKSGTNEFHGDVFYYNRDNSLGSRNPLAFYAGPGGSLIAIKPKDQRHQWGAAIGGPIVKDKLFFFFSYDQQKRDFPGLARTISSTFFNPINVVAPADCSAPVNTLTPGQLLACRGITQTQVNNTMSFLQSLTGEVPRKGDQTLFFPKIDWHINDKNIFTVSYNRLRWDSPNGVQTQPTNTRGRASFGDDLVSIDALNARLQTTVSSNIINEFRFQWGRDFERQVSVDPAPGEPSTALGGTRAPTMFITNGFDFGTPNFLDRASYPDERRFQFADTVSWVKGRHNIKFGVDLNRVEDKIDNLFNGPGSFSYNNIGDFIIDYSNWVSPIPGTTACINSTRTVGKCYTSNFAQGFGAQGLTLRTWDYNLFVQDDFRITPRLTLNLGLRWEYIQMPEVQLPNSSTVVIPTDGRTIAEATSNLPSDTNNFGPRIGIAYDLFGNGKGSLRGGYGMYYGRIQSSTIYNAMINTGNPNGQFQVSLSGASAAAPIFPNVLPSAAAAGGGAVQFFSEDFQAPLIHQYDLIFDYEVARNTGVSVSYIGSTGRNLPTFYDLNYQQTGTTTYTVNGGPYGGQTFSLPLYGRIGGVVGTQAFTRIQSTVTSQYHALVLSANRRFTDGIQFNTSYTLAKSNDTNQNSATFTQTNSPYDIFDPSYDKGPSNFDVRHKFVASLVYAPTFYKGSDRNAYHYLLNGWQISPILISYSGRPYSPTVSGTSLNGSNGGSFLPIAGRNSERLPSMTNIDLRLSKRFNLTESMNLEFLAEAFNLFNTTHIFGVNSAMYVRSGNNLNFNNSYGVVSSTESTLYRERQVQFAVRFQF